MACEHRPPVNDQFTIVPIWHGLAVYSTSQRASPGSRPRPPSRGAPVHNWATIGWRLEGNGPNGGNLVRKEAVILIIFMVCDPFLPGFDCKSTDAVGVSKAYKPSRPLGLWLLMSEKRKPANHFLGAPTMPTHLVLVATRRPATASRAARDTFAAHLLFEASVQRFSGCEVSCSKLSRNMSIAPIKTRMC